MDRLQTRRQVSAGLSLALVLGTLSGCRNTRPEVPPERPYATAPNAGTTAPPNVGFSTEPAANGYSGAATTAPVNVPGAYGMGAPQRTAPPGPPSSFRQVPSGEASPF